jgi:hypothetical protein
MIKPDQVTVVQDGDSALLTFPFDQDANRIVRHRNGRWDRDAKAWRVPDADLVLADLAAWHEANKRERDAFTASTAALKWLESVPGLVTYHRDYDWVVPDPGPLTGQVVARCVDRSNTYTLTDAGEFQRDHTYDRESTWTMERGKLDPASQVIAKNACLAVNLWRDIQFPPRAVDPYRSRRKPR